MVWTVFICLYLQNNLDSFDLFIFERCYRILFSIYFFSLSVYICRTVQTFVICLYLRDVIDSFYLCIFQGCYGQFLSVYTCMMVLTDCFIRLFFQDITDRFNLSIFVLTAFTCLNLQDCIDCLYLSIFVGCNGQFISIFICMVVLTGYQSMFVGCNGLSSYVGQYYSFYLSVFIGLYTQFLSVNIYRMVQTFFISLYLQDGKDSFYLSIFKDVTDIFRLCIFVRSYLKFFSCIY